MKIRMLRDAKMTLPGGVVFGYLKDVVYDTDKREIGTNLAQSYVRSGLAEEVV